MVTVAVSIFIIVLVLCMAVPTIYGFFIGAPIVYSPQRATREALEFLQAQPGEKFYDLGMGNGRVIAIAAREFGLQAEGFELSPVLFLVSWFNLIFSGVKNFKIYLKNFYNQDLSQASIIFCFLTPPAMEKLKTKFARELKPGTKIISYAFSIKGWQEVKIINNDLPGKIFIYEIV